MRSRADRGVLQLDIYCGQVLGLTGAQLIEALENGVSQYPKLEGRFPTVSGIQFEFDPRNPAGSRVIAGTVFVDSKPIDLQREYRTAVKAYLAHGKDGYDVFKEGRLIADEEACSPIKTLVRNTFKAIRILNRYSRGRSRSPIPRSNSVELMATLWKDTVFDSLDTTHANLRTLLQGAKTTLANSTPGTKSFQVAKSKIARLEETLGRVEAAESNVDESTVFEVTLPSISPISSNGPISPGLLGPMYKIQPEVEGRIVCVACTPTMTCLDRVLAESAA
jgi:hypothetical protein